MVVSNRNVLFQGSIFRGKLLVSGRVYIKVGPPTSYKWSYNSTYRGEKKQLPIYKAVYRGYNSIYNWWGPTLNVNMHLLLFYDMRSFALIVVSSMYSRKPYTMPYI